METNISILVIAVLFLTWTEYLLYPHQMKIRITKDYIIFIFYYLLSFILNVLRLITIRQAQKKTHSAVEFFVPVFVRRLLELSQHGHIGLMLDLILYPHQIRLDQRFHTDPILHELMGKWFQVTF